MSREYRDSIGDARSERSANRTVAIPLKPILLLRDCFPRILRGRNDMYILKWPDNEQKFVISLALTTADTKWIIYKDMKIITDFEKKHWPWLVGLAILLASVPLAVFLATKQESFKLQSKAAILQGKSFLAIRADGDFEPSKLPFQKAVTAGDQVDLAIFLDTGDQYATGVDLVLRYDPQRLTLNDSSLKLGNIFSYYTGREINARQGVLKLRSEGAYDGYGIFARLSFVAQEAGEAEIKFIWDKDLPDKTVVFDENDNNYLGGVANGTILIGD